MKSLISYSEDFSCPSITSLFIKIITSESRLFLDKDVHCIDNTACLRKQSTFTHHSRFTMTGPWIINPNFFATLFIKVGRIV